MTESSERTQQINRMLKLFPFNDKELSAAKMRVVSQKQFEESINIPSYPPREIMELNLESPAELLQNVEQFEGAFIGQSSVVSFVNSTKQKMISDPESDHIIIGMGLAGSGKTILLKEFTGHLISPTGDVAVSAAESGDEHEIYDVPWGDAFPLEDEISMEGIPYHESEYLTERKRFETQKATERISETIKKIISTPRKPGRRRIIISDIPFVTGYEDEDGDGNRRVVGIPRGFSMIKDLAQKTGKFSNGRYTLHGFTMTAFPEVRQKAIEDRKNMNQLEKPEDVAEVLRQRGIIFDGDTLDKIDQYKSESAPPNEIMLLDKDLTAVMLTEGLIDTALFSEWGYEVFSVNEMDKVIKLGREIFPKLLRKAGFPEENLISLKNATVLNEIHVSLTVGKHYYRPLR